MPDVAPVTAAAIMPVITVIPRPDVNHRPISVITVRIPIPIPVAIGAIPIPIAVTVSVADRHTEADSDMHTRLCPRRARKCERADGQRDKKKLLPVHDESSVNA